MLKEANKFSGELKIMLGSGLFALIPVFVKLSGTLSIITILAGRISFTALLLFIFSKNRLLLFKVKPIQLVHIFVWSGLMLGAMLCYFFSIKETSIAISSALLGSQPIIMLILGIIILKEKFKPTSGVALIICVAGILLISTSGNNSETSSIKGIIAGLCSSLLLSLHFLYQKLFLQHENEKKLLMLQCLLQLPLLIPFLNFGAIKFTSENLASVFMLAFFCTYLAYLLIYSGTKSTSIQKIGILQSIEYALPLFIGIYFFNEEVSYYKFCGAALIVLSCVIISQKSFKRNAILQVKAE